jgi:predicted ATPase
MIKALGLGVANTSGICLLLEDVQEYDRASIAFFQSLVDDNNPGNVRIVSTSEIGLFPSREQYKYRLSPLDAQGVETLIHRHVRNGVLRTLQLKKKILSTSHGNPLHAIQSLRCVDEGGEVYKELDSIVEKRLANLTPEARQVFEAICALGRSVSTNLLNELLCDDSLFLALEWLLLAGWISVDVSRNVAPTHQTVARIVRELMPQKQLLKLHQDILSVLEKRNVPVFVLARHAWEGKVSKRAIELLEQAGDEAYTWFDEEQAALEYYKRAVHVARWDLLMGEDNPDYLNLQLKLGKALRQSGHHVTAKVVLKEIISTANRFPDIRAKAESLLYQSNY